MERRLQLLCMQKIIAALRSPHPREQCWSHFQITAFIPKERWGEEKEERHTCSTMDLAGKHSSRASVCPSQEDLLGEKYRLINYAAGLVHYIIKPSCVGQPWRCYLSSIISARNQAPGARRRRLGTESSLPRGAIASSETHLFLLRLGVQ